MEISEKELEDIIFYSDQEELNERGYHLPPLKKRQLKIGNYGIADIVFAERHQIEGCIYSYLNITVVELKKGIVDGTALFQAIRYVKGIQKYLDEYYPTIEYAFSIHLIGQNVDMATCGFLYLTDLVGQDSYFGNGLINSIRYYKYEMSLDGFKFKNISGYSLVESGFTRKEKPINPPF